mmetsp:Transcript_14535/g.21892  ORF Transcript_14535/g.21892 Transcript_14535/m.21892 type:complete len:533 (-) Transcript_14535:129-1727(-)
MDEEYISPENIRRWERLIASHSVDEIWLWQYWKDEYRPHNQINKKLLNRFNSKLKAQKELKDLIRNGIPNDYRGAIWWACSGGAGKMISAAPESFNGYLMIAMSSPSPAEHDIMKDLHRTFPCNESLNTEEGIESLRRILLAYAVRNREVGYCQSMNFIVAVLLMYLSEEQAFWVLAALVEDILPRNYYTASMLGCRVDQAVFQSCLAWKLPKVFSHFREHDMILEPVTCSWFLCLYVNSLPLKEVLRIWDCVFWEGNVVLFRVGLAVCKIMESEILMSSDFGSMFKLLKKPLSGHEYAAQSVLDTAFDKTWLGSIPRSKLEELRGEHKAAIIAEHEEAARMKRERKAQERKRISNSSTLVEFDDTPQEEGNEESDGGDAEEYVMVESEEIQSETDRSSDKGMVVVEKCRGSTTNRRSSLAGYDGAADVLSKVLTEGIPVHAQDSLDSTVTDDLGDGDYSNEEPLDGRECDTPPPLPEATLVDSSVSPNLAFQRPNRRASKIMLSMLEISDLADLDETVPTSKSNTSSEMIG